MSGQPGGSGFRFKPAVSLTYDGADFSHLELVLPCLSEYGIRGTFYLPEVALLDDIQAWQSASNEGHEIGCHSLLEAADGLGNLPKWTLEIVEADLRSFRKLLTEVLPHQLDCSFAYPGIETVCMSTPYEPLATSYVPIVEALFPVARSRREGLADPVTCNVQSLESIDARDLTLDDLVVAAEAAIVERRWAVFAFGPIGAGDGAVDRGAHEAFVRWLVEHDEKLRVGTVFDIGMEVREKRAAVEGAYSWSLGTED